MAQMRLFLAAACCCALVYSQESKTENILDSKIKAKITGFAGHVSLYAKNLDTGATYALAADEPVRTASTIKLPIMIECFSEAAEGKLDLAEGLNDGRRKGFGQWHSARFSSGREYPLRDLITLMITLSDNTATNLISIESAERRQCANGKTWP